MSLGSAIRGVLLAALAPVGMAACGSSDPDSDARSRAITKTPTPTAQPAVADGPASVKVGKSRLGAILVDSSGRTLYLFKEDEPRRSLCTSDYLNCTTSWPPLMTHGRPHGQAGAKPRLVGSFHRTKPAGSQVMYNDHPLYLYNGDKNPGELNGQGSYSYWYVISPSGRPITKK
jgi:predicted lipoprotein with Yx(FWY)xxD motif